MNHLAAMKQFVRIADAGSLTEAARRSGCSLATVVRGLAALEEHLGARLINRSTRRMALTDTGTDFLARARDILAQVEEAESVAAMGGSKPRGVLTVSAPLQFGRLHVAPVLADLLERETDLSTELVLSDRNVDLLEDGIDASVRIGDLADSSLVAMEVGRVRRVICASPEYLQRRGIPRTAAELPSHDCLPLLSVRNAPWSFGGALPATRTRFASNTVEVLIDAALRGQGLVSLLSYQVADALRAGLLVEVLTESAPTSVPVSVVHPHRRHMPAKVRCFRDAMLARKPHFDAVWLMASVPDGQRGPMLT